MLELSLQLKAWRELFEERFSEVQTRLYPTDESLHRACRYALSGQGKRVRPLLALASAAAMGGDPERALNFAIAIEMIHTYSLVHDDLPCMDDDDMRRGRATTHIMFDEATALLVGDALLTDALALVAEDPSPQAAKAVATLARAAGGRGMVQGQALDMHWTGRSDFTRADLDAIHRHKTGDLIAASCVLGGLIATVSTERLAELKAFGHDLGLAFQIIDDLLDESEGTGKSQGKDLESGKLTYLRLMSRDEAQDYARTLTERTQASASAWGDRAFALQELAAALLNRSL